MRVSYIADKLIRSPRQYPARDVASIRGIAVHHSGARNGPEMIARTHVLERKWPGIGYHFVIDDNAGPSRVYQTAEIDRSTYHAGVHNGSRIAVCLVGNFDRAAPHPNQLHALSLLCAELCAMLDLGDPSDRTGPLRLWGRVVAGHRELWGSSAKVGKSCPGDRFDMDGLRLLASLAYMDRINTTSPGEVGIVIPERS